MKNASNNRNRNLSHSDTQTMLSYLETMKDCYCLFGIVVVSKYIL